MKKYERKTIAGESYLTKGFWGNEENGIHLIPTKYKMTSIGKKIKVVEYWARRVCETEIGTDWDVATFHCWRCGKKDHKLELAHIVPKVLTKEKKSSTSECESNLVLLCKDCHKAAPDVIDESVIWNWIKRTTKGSWELFRLDEISKEFENMYGEDLMKDYIRNTEVVNENFNQKEFFKTIRTYLKNKSNNHSMEYSASTWAWIFKETFKNSPQIQ